MKTMTKKRITMVAGVVAAGCLALSLGMTEIPDVGAEATTSFKMEGASIRIDNPTGLRFASSVLQAEYDEMSQDYDLSVGMLVIPRTELTGNLDLDNETDEIVHIENITPFAVEEDDTYQFRAVVKDIPETAYGAEVIARSYVQYQSKTDETISGVIWTDALSRNVAYVAYKASNDNDDGWYDSLTDTQKGCLSTYIGGRDFYEVSLGADVSCDYDYAFAGQKVEVEMSNVNVASVLSVTDAENAVVDVETGAFTMPESKVTVEKLNVLDMDLTDKRASDFWQVYTTGNGLYPTGTLTFGETVEVDGVEKTAMKFYNTYNTGSWSGYTSNDTLGSYTRLCYTCLKPELVAYAKEQGYLSVSLAATTYGSTKYPTEGALDRIIVRTVSSKSSEFDANETVNGDFNYVVRKDSTKTAWKDISFGLSAITDNTFAIAGTSDTLYVSGLKFFKPDFTKDFASAEMAGVWTYYGSQATVSYEENINADGTVAEEGSGVDAIKLYGANHTADFNSTSKYLSAFYLKTEVAAKLIEEGYTKMTITYSFIKDSAGNGTNYRVYLCDYDGSGSVMDHNSAPKHFTTGTFISSSKSEKTWNTYEYSLTNIGDGETIAIAWWMQTMYISSITFSK